MQREAKYLLDDAAYFHVLLFVAPLRTGCIASSVLHIQSILMRASLLLVLNCELTGASHLRDFAELQTLLGCLRVYV